MLAFERHTIFLTLAGSQAHGTAREGSDVDLRGVCIAPLSVRLSLFCDFDQVEGPLPDVLGNSVLPRLRGHPTASLGLDVKAECVIYDVAKFIRLCADANPNTLEVLFADERDWVYDTPVWRRLYDERHLFLTKKVQQTFHGYAIAQLKKIKTHRSWLLNPPVKKPAREDYGLPVSASALSRDDQHRIEQGIAEKIRAYGIDNVDMPKQVRIAMQQRLQDFHSDLLAATGDDLEARMRALATHALGLPSGVVAGLNAEKKYRAAMKHWESYQSWKRQRNPARASLEREHGYDTKHAMHLVRLMRMGLEVLETGGLQVRRHDAEELLAIRDGAMSFDELLAAAAGLREAMERAVATTTLPDDVDRSRVDALAIALMSEASA